MRLRTRGPLPLAVLTGVAYATTLLVVAGPLGTAVTVAIHALMIVPGVMAVRAVAPGQWLALGTFAPMLGLVMSAAVMLAGWAAGLRGASLLLVAPVVATLSARPLRRLANRWRLTAGTRSDLTAWLLVLLLVPLVVARPFSRVGEERPEGRVYRSYFTADYVWRRAVVAELAKGEVPPRNPFYLDDALHYYWLGHLPDAVEYQAVGDRVALDSLLLGSSVIVDAAFVSAIYGVARLVVPSPWAALAGVGWAFLLTSFEGAAALWHQWQGSAPVYRLRDLNIDAVSRWIYGGMPIDGLHRILWYQPHHAMAYVVGLLGLLTVVRRNQRRDAEVFVVAGMLLGLVVLLSSFVALIFTAAIALHEGVATVWRRDWWSGAVNVSWAALPMAVATAITTALEYIDHHQAGTAPLLRFGVNEMAVANAWVATSLSAGPALLTGGAGLWLAWRRRVDDLRPFAVLVATSIAFYVYVDVRDHQDVYVGWRTGHIVFIALAPAIALLLRHLRQASATVRRAAGWSIVAIVALGAAPTVLIDAFNTQDVENQTRGPGFDYTLVLTRPEIEGLDWIRTHTSPRALVQVDPYSRDSNTWAYLPAFAERRMAVGLPLGLVPLHKYVEGSKRVRWLYDAPDPFGAYELASRVGIDYIVVGPPERHDHPGVEARYARADHLMPQVFHNDALSVYEVLRPGHVH